MSGYKNGAFGTQEEYHAAMAAAAFYGVQPEGDEDAAADLWDRTGPVEQAQWRRAAKVVRDETRMEPRF